MAESVVSGVATRLGNLLAQEAIYLTGVSDKVHDLQAELRWMQCYLKDADKKQNESAIVKNGIAEMKDLAYDAEDVIATYALTVASRRGRGIQKFLKRCASILDEGIRVHQVGLKIDVLKTRISNLKRFFKEYGIKRESAKQAGEPQPMLRETYSHPQDGVVGFDENLNRLVEFLLEEGKGKRVAFICGMGGLGKTTLAKMVYNDTRVTDRFKHRAWACISQQCQKSLVWKDILISLCPQEKDQSHKLADKEIVDKLCKVQKERECLVILDDIWDVETWNHLREVFAGNDTESKILLTSRNEKVYQHEDLARGFLYELRPLDEARSLELLEKIAISGRKDSVAETYTKEFGNEMIGYCGGLPLAITVLGGLLATKQTWGEWENVLKHAKSYLHMEDSRVNNVLALSYNDLPSHLKPCFLYLGHFPEDFEITTKELIRMWMGEGFISQIQHRGGIEDTMDDVGDRYLRELVQRCMVLVGKKGSFGRIKTCRVHDLMREFCVSKAQEENFLHFTNTLSMKQREAQIGKVRRLAIISESGDNSIKGIKFNEYPYLRSLLYLLPQRNESIFKESCFKKFKMVRVLHLVYFKNHLRKLPKDIGCLIHLRYLSLKGSNINEVPSSIGNLRCLETLDLRINLDQPYDCILLDYIYQNSSLLDSIYGPRVPNVFKYMKQLKHLYLPNEYIVCGKLELANLSYLQTLVNVQPNTIHIPTWFKLNRLRLLKVRNKYNKWAQDAMQMLMSRCPLVDKLNLYNPIRKFPEAHQFSPNVAMLTLWCTSLKEDPMPTLEKLPNLKVLILCDSFRGKDMVCSKGRFPLLQYLLLDCLFYLEEWRVEERAMPSLCHLIIDSCYSLKTIPDGLRFVTTLQELEIRYMSKSFQDRLDEGGLDFDKVKLVIK